MIFSDVAATVGRTPMVELARVSRGLPGRIFAKLEMRHPCGSVKDRLGLALIDDAERNGRLRSGSIIVEATGGNTGIGLAFVAAIRGYRLVLTMPETMSTERVAPLRYLGAEVVLTPGILMNDAVARAASIAAEMHGAVTLDQFANPANRGSIAKRPASKFGTIAAATSTSSFPRSAPAAPSLIGAAPHPASDRPRSKAVARWSQLVADDRRVFHRILQRAARQAGTLRTASRAACIRAQSSQPPGGVRQSYDNPCGSWRKARAQANEE